MGAGSLVRVRLEDMGERHGRIQGGCVGGGVGIDDYFIIECWLISGVISHFGMSAGSSLGLGGLPKPKLSEIREVNIA